MYQDNFEDELTGYINVDVVADSYAAMDEYVDGEVAKELEEMKKQQKQQRYEKAQEQLQEGVEQIPAQVRDFIHLEERIMSFDNYCDLFNHILNSEKPVELELPNKWLWDIIDEFIYQFQSFCTYRSNLSKKAADTIEVLKNNTAVWNTHSVLNVLYSLVAKSKICEQLQASVNGQDPTVAAGEYGNCSLYKMLGYFSLVGLLRVHCMMGDYTLALQSLENIELGNHRALFTRVPACHVTLYYYVGFSYLMMRRYSDATRIFANILTFILRTRQYQTRSFQFDIVNKKADQMYALMAICLALSPTRVDEQIHSHLREKYGEQQSRMQRGGDDSLATFQELFLYACPKFISPNPPNYDAYLSSLSSSTANPNPTTSTSTSTSTSNPDTSNPNSNANQTFNRFELQEFQMKIFMHEVSLQLIVPTLRSFLRLYTSMKLDKLASFLDISPAELHTQLLVFKQRASQLKWSGGPNLLDGLPSSIGDLGFAIDNDVVYIAENKVGRKYADWFIRNSAKIGDLVKNLESNYLLPSSTA
ncbi:Eukaryotic translation initiation factor 3 subunit L [Zancudomyces culisetae]|uniref:Eukaryotic translation initiation factor 3 subunit L n=1 Tax=Zancudomyces culisetae TaxID=1213189 RepID=A0A1R1PT89_ZANCU|nr:Eukaryotic translation initiation factor 3 subunit L [Zancudomyces culisetae]|eukprot:OMH84171.1 Eukaryotic translation initiation factor 3 subunit L [Zancudomyces culisetae]